MSLADATSPRVPLGGTVLVPVGATEQHGPHLPLDTDTVIATAVAEGLAPLVGGVVAPAVAFGASGEHQSFAGTASIGTSTLHLVIVELVRSLRTWTTRVVLVNGHGGNTDAIGSAVRQLRGEGHLVDVVACSVPGRSGEHAGHVETSVMLHLAPSRVRLRDAVAGNTEPLAALLPRMRAGGVAAVSGNGVLGDPTAATAVEGAVLLASMIDAAHSRLRVPSLG